MAYFNCRIIYSHLRLAGILASCFSMVACDSAGNIPGEPGTFEVPGSNFQIRPTAIRTINANTVENGGELLVNANFSNQLTGWAACNDNSSISVENSTAILA